MPTLSLSLSGIGDLYIADSCNDRIQVLDSSLHPIREITHSSLHTPLDVRLSTEEIYVLNSKDSPHLHFTQTGLKIRSLITRSDLLQIYRPSFFCLVANKIIISDAFGIDPIKIFSYEGVLLYTIEEDKYRKGGVYYPGGFAVTSDLKLVTASSNKYHTFNIFFYLGRPCHKGISSQNFT